MDMIMTLIISMIIRRSLAASKKNPALNLKPPPPGKKGRVFEMSSVIKISNQPFNEELIYDLGNAWTWILLYWSKIYHGHRVSVFTSLQDAKDAWTNMLDDNYRTPVSIHPRALHLPYCKEEWFNCSLQLK